MEIEIMSYETLIRRAFNCPRQSKHGAQKEIMRNAIWAEQGVKIKNIGSRQKQLADIKKYLSKALIKLSKTKPYSKSSALFIVLDKALLDCNHSSELMVIVNTALEEAIKLNKSLYI